MDAWASWSLSLLISGSFYLEDFVLDVKVEILGVGWARGAREEGQIPVP